MPSNYNRTKRPHEALLDLYIDKKLVIVERRRDPDASRGTMEHLPLLILSLTFPNGSSEGTVYGC
jgi:hypothetical protein